MSAPPSPTTPAHRWLQLSARLYRPLLLLYPPEFRRSFGREMEQTFRTCCREALREAGAPGLLRLWGNVLYDLTTSATVEHIRAWIALFKRLSGLEKELHMINSPFHLEFAQLTDIGLKRARNEDAMTTVIPSDQEALARRGALFVVADGLGGHERGEMASQLAINTISDAYYRSNGDDIAAALARAIHEANTAIYALSSQQEHEDEKEMGTTVVAAVLRGETVYAANVGDSRAYIVRGGKVQQITQDHSWVAEQVRLGALTEEEARAHQKRNIIYRCLGTSPDVEIDLYTESVQGGDALLLCTDGLSGLVSDDEMAEIVEHYSPQESVQRLIQRANEQGGSDNITAIVARVSLA
ncbi:MAG TPA: Stp1/IreP family PP2C-type Ser/Thr phosphatase [Ktedonobacteraceae bacterium]|nr:Stp1/IreP family PP2C-type Ser/Thr phosphatase [Ktedonobacteraceae bacterium]